MKKTLLTFVCLVLIVFVGIVIVKAVREKVRQDLERPIPYPTASVMPTVPFDANQGPQTQSLFVPYWALTEKTADTTAYNEYIYFGVAATTNGIDMVEQGATNASDFISFVPAGKKKLLGVRMVNTETNFAILKDQKKQKKIIDEAIAFAKEKEFDGVVLDLEVSAIPFESLVKQITDFTGDFYQQTNRNGLSFSMTVYGDVFYRLRPFDVKALAKHADKLMIMAYDFSKAKGNPGPNFPLRGRENYGYDYERMTDDFLRVVPSEKLTVIFGLFGYDWIVDNQGHTLQQAKAVTNQEIEKKFVENCRYRNCSVTRDSEAAEGQVYYRDDAGAKHIIWFEDMESVRQKKAFLRSRGINSFSYWAYSYF
jgi:spore germination protein YaaH